MTTLQSILALVATLVPILIPVVTPIIIVGVKSVVTKTPSWLLPILAPIVGTLLDAGLGWLGSASVGPAWAALLGAAGVGVREIVDQVKKALQNPTT